jgi:UDP-N-acetylglucosamine 1-carboxyvinyltransferase
VDLSEHDRVWTIEGGRPISGTVRVSGAKNAATKELVATVLTDEPCELRDVPVLGDTAVTLDMLSDLGAEFERDGSTVRIQTPEITGSVSERYSGINRIPILMLGPLLSRVGEAVVPLVGGCAIGDRPVGYHVDGLTAMGAEISIVGKTMVARASQLKGCKHRLPYPSVGATENLVLAAVRARGTTVIENAAIEPEIIDLVLFLQQMGAQIQVDVGRRIIVEGVDRLSGATHRVIPDRIEAASYACAAIATGGEVDLLGAQQSEMVTFLNVLRRVGGRFAVHDEGIRFWADEGKLRPWHLETDVHPGFMTDWQQPTVVLLTQAEGVSVIHETVYENRFGYTETLVAMGAHIELSSQCLGPRACRFADGDFPHSAVVSGPTTLTGGDLVIPDLRAGFAYVMAALCATGESRLHNIWYLERGYEDIPGKLADLGVAVDTGVTAPA